MRAGTYAKIYNTLVKGKANCLTTETVETENSLVNGTSVLEYIHLENTISSKEGIYSESLFTENGKNKINQTINISNKYVGSVSGGKDMVSVNSFFENASFIGAVNANDNWTTGWTK